MKNLILPAFTVILLSACAIADPKVSAVAAPAAFINVNSAQKVVDKLTELCDRHGLAIDESAGNSVTCSKEASFMAQALIGTNYGTPVRGRVRFNAFMVKGSGVKIVGNAWNETQNAFGQTQRMEINAADTRQSMQNLMDEAKAELEGK